MDFSGLYNFLVAVYLPASGILYISTNCKSYKKLDGFAHIHRKPETMALRGAMFAVGTKAGGFVSRFKDSIIMYKSVFIHQQVFGLTT